jgi:hypothetical protein
VRSSDNGVYNDFPEQHFTSFSIITKLLVSTEATHTHTHTQGNHTGNSIGIYKTILKPTVMYGREAWSMTEKDKTRLNMWEREILRKVYGPVTEQGVWRIRRNEE